MTTATPTLATSRALEVFLRGFSTTRSYISPYVPQQLDEQIWIVADPPSSKGKQRTPEMVSWGVVPEQVRAAQRHAGVDRHTLCILVEDPDSVSTAIDSFKAAGYRLLGREPLFVLDLEERARFESPAVRRVSSAADASVLTKATRARMIFPQHFTEGDSECRVYAAYDGDQPIGWVRSIRTHPDCAWVASLFVHSAHRRRGLGRALMSAMLDDDHRFGVRWSVLLASLTGALLYPHLGYRQLGLLLVFSPRNAATPA